MSMLIGRKRPKAKGRKKGNGPTSEWSNVDLRNASPFLKYAGGKGQLLDKIAPLIPPKFNRYFEPFLGGGAVFFYMVSNGMRFNAYLSDVNSGLITTYIELRDNVQEVIRCIQTYEIEYKKFVHYSVEQQRYYWLLRDLYRNLVTNTPPEFITSNSKKYKKNPEYLKELRYLYNNLLLSIKRESNRDIMIATLLITINKTCFNGLFREGSNGFSAPPGESSNGKNPTICDITTLESVSNVLRYFRPILSAGDYMDATENARRDDFVYLDPPYDPKSASSNFTSYTKGGFGRKDQVQLAGVFRKLSDRGCMVLLSNSDTPFIRELYSDFTIMVVDDVLRSISSNTSKRKGRKELLISNYSEDTSLRLYPQGCSVPFYSNVK